MGVSLFCVVAPYSLSLSICVLYILVVKNSVLLVALYLCSLVLSASFFVVVGFWLLCLFFHLGRFVLWFLDIVLLVWVFSLLTF